MESKSSEDRNWTNKDLYDKLIEMSNKVLKVAMLRLWDKD